jgi:N-carbamoyl-L-amino-acid hydrolase
MGHRMIRGMDRRAFTLSLLAAAAAISTPAAAQNTAALRVNGKRLSDHLGALSEFGKNPFGGVSRGAYTEADKQGRDYVMGLMRAARLDTAIART